MTNEVIVFVATKVHIVILLCAVLSAFFIQPFRRKQIFLLTLIALPSVFIASRLMSLFIYHPRPFVVDAIEPLFPHIANNGFPSDHALLVATVASLVFVYNKPLGIILFGLGILVGVARVLSDVHHASDVIGSFVIAILTVYLGYKFIKWLPKFI